MSANSQPEDGPSLGACLLGLRGTVSLSNIARGTTLYMPGDPADRVFVLTGGRVKISVEGSGGKHCLFHVVEAGEVFGEETLMGEETRPASAEVIEKASVTMALKVDIDRLATEQPDFWKLFAALLAGRLQNLRQHLQWVTFLEVEQRIARLILQWERGARSEHEQASAELQLSQRDLAGLVGATRETTSGALNRLQRAGCIELRRRRIIVKSVESLLARSGNLPGATLSASTQRPG